MTGRQLKYIACFAMLIDHIGAILLTPFIDLSMKTNAVYLAFRLIGRLAFPIYCFLLIEGFRHTSNSKKYLSRMAAFAVISEVPFDCAFNNCILEFKSQNVFVTLFLGLLMLILLEISKGKIGRRNRSVIVCTVIILFTAALNQLGAHGSYGAGGILAIAALYFFRNSSAACMATCAVLLMENNFQFFAFTVWPLIAGYNGEQGKSKHKLLFYIFYPVHILLLIGIRYFII